MSKYQDQYAEEDEPVSNPQLTEQNILRSIRPFYEPGEVFELRILKAGNAGTVSGYFNDLELFAKAAAFYSGKAPGVYFTLNPVEPALLARAKNKVVERAVHTTSDEQILCRRWLPIDLDPVRPAGISTTDGEHKLALTRAEELRAHLRHRGWPEPLLASSGNGAHLLYQVDLPNDQASRELVRRILESLDNFFSDDRVQVDTSVHNAARIWKVYGTLTCKGENLPDRPHRYAQILGGPGYDA